jgi:hypothetical protein
MTLPKAIAELENSITNCGVPTYQEDHIAELIFKAQALLSALKASDERLPILNCVKHLRRTLCEDIDHAGFLTDASRNLIREAATHPDLDKSLYFSPKSPN